MLPFPRAFRWLRCRFVESKTREQPRSGSARRRPLLLELLERRLAPSVSVSFPQADAVSFSGGSSDNLYLQVANGALQSSSTGTSYAPVLNGSTPFTIDANTTISVNVGKTLYLGNMQPMGGTITSQGALEIQQNAVISTRDIATGGNPLTAASIGELVQSDTPGPADHRR